MKSLVPLASTEETTFGEEVFHLSRSPVLTLKLPSCLGQIRSSSILRKISYSISGTGRVTLRNKQYHIFPGITVRKSGLHKGARGHRFLRSRTLPENVFRE